MTRHEPEGASKKSRTSTKEITLFVPFDVTRTTPLADALERRVVRPGEPMLVLEPGEGRPPLVFVTSQMTYHHVAQGELAGEPYAVTF